MSEQRGYLNWTCELRELTRQAAFFFKDEVPRLRSLHFGDDPIECGAIR